MSVNRLLATVAFATCLMSVALPGQAQAPSPASQAPSSGPVVTVPEPSPPRIAPASEEGERALAGFQLPSGFAGSLFAAEPRLANPVAFYIDSRGRFFVCESFRQNAGVTDNRGHDEAWLDDDLAAQTVADRIAYHRKHLGEKVAEYEAQDDRIRLIEDLDGDGRADRATVFADGFHSLAEGTGAGVLEYQGDVFYTCIPNLWRLRDEDRDGRADQRTALHRGFGVRVAFRGHDLHGLQLGPDGRLYFSIGDRGYHVETAGGTLADPASGAVFRCELDGSDLEVVATGLRNPQELAFDEFGNLFTGDNNSDSGDKARWVYVVPGSDSGWRMEYQYLTDRGPFNREKIWHPFHTGQPAYIVPPVTNLADGPSGLAYYPGSGLSPHFDGRFFLCDFRGGPVNSGIRTFRVKPRGAFFEVVDQEQSFWNILATDVQFGPDGAVYVTDWVNGWNGEGKGRIYRFADQTASRAPIVQQVRQLLATGFAEHSVSSLLDLLSHADQRVRQEAQFELARRQSLQPLSELVTDRTQPQLARLHALWGLHQIARAAPPARLEFAGICTQLLRAADAEIRAQAARLAGELRYGQAAPALIDLLKDESLRVRSFAAASLGSLESPDGLDPLCELLAENADRDPIVRHGGIMGLTGAQPARLLDAALSHESASVRLAAVVALRKQGDAGVAAFLDDPDPLVVVEAARAIHDLPVPEALPTLAARAGRPSEDDAMMHRVLNANFRLGKPVHAGAIAAVAAADGVSDAMRIEALEMLADWSEPSPRDRVLGRWQPLAPRSAETARVALREVLPNVLQSSPAAREKVVDVARQFGFREIVPFLRERLADPELAAPARAAALRALVHFRADDLASLVREAVQHDVPEIRAAARTALVAVSPDDAARELAAAVRSATMIERQAAVAGLSQLEPSRAAVILIDACRDLVAGRIHEDTRLDLVEAARAVDSAELQRLLRRYEAARPATDELAPFADSLVGGDPRRGSRLFYERTDLSCVRCHAIHQQGGKVGPDLGKIGTQKRRYLLEAIVAPNKTIAKGFESATLVDANGKVHVGVVKEESEAQITIARADGRLLTFAQDDLEDRAPAQSPMPADLMKHLSHRELRDLVAFLAAQDGTSNRPAGTAGHEQ